MTAPAQPDAFATAVHATYSTFVALALMLGAAYLVARAWQHFFPPRNPYSPPADVAEWREANHLPTPAEQQRLAEIAKRRRVQHEERMVAGGDRPWWEGSGAVLDEAEMREGGAA